MAALNAVASCGTWLLSALVFIVRVSAAPSMGGPITNVLCGLALESYAVSCSCVWLFYLAVL